MEKKKKCGERKRMERESVKEHNEIATNGSDNNNKHQKKPMVLC